MTIISNPIAQGLAAAGCGWFVSFSLGLVGGGGSILAVPLIIYVAGVHDTHLAIGTAALAVAVSAYLNMIPHARAGHIKWGAALAFAASGVVGAAVGSSVGKIIDGQSLSRYFAILMLLVAVFMLRSGRGTLEQEPQRVALYSRLCGTGLGAGGVSGFFGIGGGFLVVPGLVFAARMQIADAIGTSLFAVGSFGLTTAVNYSLSGEVDWRVAGEFVAGGLVGGWLGARAAGRLANRRGVLTMLFSAMIVLIAAYMLYRSWET